MADSTIESDGQRSALPLPRLDGLGYSVEEELLSQVSLDKVSKNDAASSRAFNSSLHWRLGQKVEWSVDFKTEFFGHSWGSDLWSFVCMDNLLFLRSLWLCSVD